MDNAADILSGILSTDEGKEALDQLKKMLADNDGDLGGLAGAVSGFANNTTESDDSYNTSQSKDHASNNSGFSNQSESKGSFFDGIDPEMLLKFGQIFGGMNKKDKNTELLMALKPHLREENQAKIDNAVKIARLISLFPYLKESGLFNDFLGGK